MKLFWTVPALRDLEALGDYIAEANPRGAERITAAIFDQTESLSEFPYKGRSGRVAATRELVIVGTPYIVPYRLRSNRVELLAVLHRARLWPEGFK